MFFSKTATDQDPLYLREIVADKDERALKHAKAFESTSLKVSKHLVDRPDLGFRGCFRMHFFKCIGGFVWEGWDSALLYLRFPTVYNVIY